MCAITVYISSNGSHLLGTEISYKHISGKKYVVEVSLYRSCNECKLGDYGGGQSNVQCDDLKEIYLAVSGLGSCERKNLGKIEVQHESFENITPVCDGVKTACDENPDVSIGIEKHIYKGEVDFDDYLEYKDCGFEFFVLISNGRSQSTNIDGEQNLYNFAYLNPWIGNNTSVQYQGIPPIFSSCNEPYYNSIGGNSIDEDEVSYQLVPPKTGVNANLRYSSTFSAIRPISVWCDGDPACRPNPTALPPVGFHFNSKTADLVFTPNNCGEGSFLAVEAKEYRTIDGVKNLIGITRRDIQLLVQDPYQNHHPQIVEEEQIKVCAGQIFEKTITLKDRAFEYPNGSLQAKDTIQINWSSNLPEGSVKIAAIDEAPFREVTITFKPTTNEVGQQYYLKLDVRDQFCPVPGTAKKTIIFEVESSPVVEISSQQVFCNQISVVTGNNATEVVLFRGNDTLTLGQGNRFQAEVNLDQKYTLFATLIASNGCKSATSVSKELKSESLIQWEFDTLCEHQTFSVDGNSSHKIKKVDWLYGSQNGKGTNTINGKAAGDSMYVQAVLSEAGNECEVNQILTLPIIRLPEIEISVPEIICANESPFSLKQLEVSPKNGRWTYQGEGSLINDTVKWNPYYISNHELEYAITDPSGRCSDSRIIQISPVESPLVELKDLTVCKNFESLDLSNFFKGNFDLTKSNQEWTLVGFEETHLFNGIGNLAIPAVLDDQYKVSLKVINESGCSSIKSANLTILNELVISHGGAKELCVNDQIDLFEELNPEPSTGFWLSLNGSDIQDNRFLINAPCDEIQLNYTIDEFGCFAEETFTINPLCMKDMSLQIPNQMCENEEEILLNDANLDNQIWTINGQPLRVFNPKQFVDQEEVVLKLANNGVSGCRFEKSFEIEIEQLPNFNWLQKYNGLCIGDSLDIGFQSTASPIFSSSCEEGTQFNVQSVFINTTCLEKIDIEVKVAGDICPDYEATTRFMIYAKNEVNLPQFNYGCLYQPLEVDLNKGIAGEYNTVSWKLMNDEYEVVHSGTSPMIISELAETGLYHLEVHTISDKGCENNNAFDSIFHIKPSPKSNFEPSVKLVNILNPTVEFINTSKFESEDVRYSWEFGLNGSLGISKEVNPVFEFPDIEAKYPVALIVENEWCKNVHLDTIQVVSGARVYIPNAFSPWGKGPEQNRTFGVSGSNIKSVKVMVFNRWGQIMFQSDDIDTRWDGTTKNGSACQGGIYIYNVEVYDHQGQKFEYAGPINLLR